MPQGIVINEILNSALQLFGSHIWCLLSIYHSLLLAIEMCKSTEMEQSRQEVHLRKSLRGSRSFLGQDLHLVSLSLLSHACIDTCSV